MWAPLVVLAILSIVVGYLGVPEFLGGSNLFHHYFEPLIQVPEAAAKTWAFQGEEHSHSLEWSLMLTSVGLAMSSALFAYFMYRRGPSSLGNVIAKATGPLHGILEKKYSVDEFYQMAFVSPLRNLGEFFFRVIDVNLVDGIVNAIAQSFTLVAGIVSFKMTGSIHRHGLMIVIGALCFLIGLVFI